MGGSLRLVDDAKHAWRWFSVQAMAITALFMTVWGSMPDDLKAAIPQWVVALVAVAVLILGIAGRLVQQGKPNE